MVSAPLTTVCSTIGLEGGGGVLTGAASVEAEGSSKSSSKVLHPTRVSEPPRMRMRRELERDDGNSVRVISHELTKSGMAAKRILLEDEWIAWWCAVAEIG